MNRSSNHRALWTLGVLALALAFASCQSGSTDAVDPVPTSERTKVVASYSIQKSEPFKKADSLTWSAPSQSGAGLVPHLSDSNSGYLHYSTSIQLKTPLKDGILNLSLWSHGIRFLQAQFNAIGTTDTLQIISGSAKVDSIALLLLKGLDSLQATLPQTRAGLLTLYGTWILAGDARIQGFPDSLPIGLSATEVIQATLVAASKTGKTLAEQAKTWSLGITTDSATSIVLKLIQSKTIASKDSSTLLPPPPVRLKTPLAVGTGLRAGGASVGVTGTFEWDDGLGLVAFQGSVTRNGAADTNLVVYGLPVPKSTDRSANFEGTVSLLAKATAPEGTYVLTITAQDGAQHTATSSASFQVAAKLPDQPSSPRIRLLSPSDKSIVPFETAEVVTTWIAATPQGTLESVKVEGTAAEKVNDSTWQAKVRLDPTGKPRTVVAKVVNSAGLEAVATAELTRQADATGPVVAWISPTVDLEVENGVTSITVKIKATDPSGIDTVLISGSKPDSLTAAGEYVRKVPLTTVGSPQAITVRVVDSAKNATTASKTITRANPATDVPPKAVLLEPSSKTGTTVPFETKSVTARWTITDPYGIDSASVTINGKPAKSEGGDKWSAVVDLVAGAPTTILLSVKNKNGVSGGDVASVTRREDTTKPVITVLAGSREVGNDSAEILVVCKASDNDSLRYVEIGGVAATLQDGVYSAKLKIEVGDSRYSIVARDRTQNATSVELSFHRYQKSSISRVAPAGADTTVGSGVGSVALSWKVVGAKSVGVGDSVLSRTNDLYAWTANLSGASTRVVLWALDSAGKRDTSEVTVTRRSVTALTLSYGLDTLGTLPDSVVISASSEIGASLSWSLDGKTWTPFTGSIVQKTSGMAQVRAQVVGKDDNIASLKAFTLYHANRAPTVVLTATSLLAKSYLGTFSATVAKVTDWGIGDGIQTGTWEVQNFDLADTQFVSKLAVDAGGKLSGFIKKDTSVVIKLRLRVKDDSGTANGGIDLSTWTEWLSITIVDTVLDPKLTIYRAIRMPDGRVWMRSNLRYQVSSAPEACHRDSCGKYGVLYSKSTAFAGGDTIAPTKGACPAGWHIAQKSEWTDLKLSTMEKGTTDSIYHLRAVGAWNWAGKGGSYGISAASGVYGDFLYPNGSFAMSGSELWVWIPRENGMVAVPTNFALQNGSLDATGQPVGAVRCVKD